MLLTGLNFERLVFRATLSLDLDYNRRSQRTAIFKSIIRFYRKFELCDNRVLRQSITHSMDLIDENLTAFSDRSTIYNIII